MKNYFNLSNYKLLNKIGILARKKKTELTVNKIFVNRPIIRFNNDVVNINIYIYNRIRFCLYHRLKKLNILNNETIKNKIRNSISNNILKKKGISANKKS